MEFSSFIHSRIFVLSLNNVSKLYFIIEYCLLAFVISAPVMRFYQIIYQPNVEKLLHEFDR